MWAIDSERGDFLFWGEGRNGTFEAKAFTYTGNTGVSLSQWDEFSVEMDQHVLP